MLQKNKNCLVHLQVDRRPFNFIKKLSVKKNLLTKNFIKNVGVYGEKGSTSWKRLKVETQMSLLKRGSQ